MGEINERINVASYRSLIQRSIVVMSSGFVVTIYLAPLPVGTNDTVVRHRLQNWVSNTMTSGRKHTQHTTTCPTEELVVVCGRLSSWRRCDANCFTGGCNRPWERRSMKESRDDNVVWASIKNRE